MLSYIKDLTSTMDKAHIGTPSSTAHKQVFCTNAGDIVSLLYLSLAVEAGESYLSSS